MMQSAPRFAHALFVLSTALLFANIPAQASTTEPKLAKQPSCERAQRTQIELGGPVAEYLRGITRQWLLIAPDANPGMLEMFRDRDRMPRRALVPWAGEFAGKYLTGAVQVYRVTHDDALRQYLTHFVGDLCALQADDGYLGPWPKDSRLTGTAPNVDKGTPGPTWDAWGHYHVMVGLLAWHAETGDQQALRTAARIGDLFCNKFLGDRKPRLVDTGSTEMNLAPVHSLCLLYRTTGEPRYLNLAQQITQEFAALGPDGKPLAGDYLSAATGAREYFETPKPRWESLHPILGLVELYYATGDERYRHAFEHWWWSIVKLDRHNNGGFSSGEQAQGNPYHQGAIETCCTIAWMTMSADMLQLTGNSVVADELELSLVNSGLGMHSPTGRWATYNTPMEGLRRASAHDIVFQSREGTPELNCCSVNCARGLGLLSEWAILRDSQGVILNWYGPGTLATTLADGRNVALQVASDYPREGRIKIKVSAEKPLQFALRLRIPYWSVKSDVKVNGEAVNGVKPAQYLVLDREWKPGDMIDLNLDLSLHYWIGERESEGKASIFRGPILLTYDRRFNTMDPADVSGLDARGLQGAPSSPARGHQPIVKLDFPGENGQTLTLCDFASAGDGGTPYLTWLRVKNVKPTPFSRENLLRSGRAAP